MHAGPKPLSGSDVEPIAADIALIPDVYVWRRMVVIVHQDDQSTLLEGMRHRWHFPYLKFDYTPPGQGTVNALAANPLERPVDLKSKLVSEIGTLFVVVRYGFNPFGSRLREELNRHDREGVA